MNRVQKENSLRFTEKRIQHTRKNSFTCFKKKNTEDIRDPKKANTNPIPTKIPGFDLIRIWKWRFFYPGSLWIKGLDEMFLYYQGSLLIKGLGWDVPLLSRISMDKRAGMRCSTVIQDLKGCKGLDEILYYLGSLGMTGPGWDLRLPSRNSVDERAWTGCSSTI